mgnify:CR=1 FL=1
MKAHCFTAENCCNDFVAAVAVLEAAVNLLATSLSLQFLLTKETIYLKARVVMVVVVLQAHLISSHLSTGLVDRWSSACHVPSPPAGEGSER